VLWPVYLTILLLELAGVASAVHALFTVRTAKGATAWIIGLITLPLVAVPLYWFFGTRRFDTHTRVMQEKFTRLAGAIGDIRERVAPFALAPSDIRPSTARTLADLARRPFVRGNRLDLLIDGPATFEALLGQIAQAEHSVYVQFYIVREDGLGTRLLEALAAAAARGVEVCSLYDSLGSSGLSRSSLAAWRERGVQIFPFDASRSWRDRWRLNFRNHRKNVVIDGRVGFIGGHNVGDEYLGLDPRFGPWRDTHVRVEGPAALQLQMSFASDWLFATSRKVAGPWDPHPSPHGDQAAVVLDSGPSDDLERCTLFFLHCITSARHRLWIASPYFVPDDGIIQALQLAAVRGVDVRILLPQKADHTFVWLASFAMLKELQLPGLTVYRYQPGFLHYKAVLVDDNLAAIGTANFDNRSFRLNFEITLAVPDEKFAAETAAMFERDFAASQQVDNCSYDALPLHLKTGVKISRLLAPIL
jgi:cardiolipin synthase